MGNSCPCMEAPDVFNIKDNLRRGEVGAGWLQKQGKSRGNWSKRFFVLTETKLIYYTDETRSEMKGELLLVGSTVKTNTTGEAKKFFPFTITHPVNGTRELAAKTDSRRVQWLQAISDVCERLDKSGAMYGILFKKGGMNKNVWQERWCVLSGTELTYFENSKEGIPKGAISLKGAQIRDFSAKDQKFCIEVVASGKKGVKKYSFSTDSEGSRKRWITALQKTAKAADMKPQQPAGASDSAGSDGSVVSPMATRAASSSNASSPRADDDDDDNASTASASSAAQPASIALSFLGKSKPQEKALPEKKGYLMKKSPTLISGWQKRYFVLKAPGEIAYYENQRAFESNSSPKGTIEIAHVMPDDQGIVLVSANEFHIRMGKRKYELQAANSTEANEWMEAINAWLSHISSTD